MIGLLEFSLADMNGGIVGKTTVNADIRTWLPGITTINTSASVPKSLPEGIYTFCIGILDPETGNPGMDLAIAGKRSDGRYRIANIIVKP